MCFWISAKLGVHERVSLYLLTISGTFKQDSAETRALDHCEVRDQAQAGLPASALQETKAPSLLLQFDIFCAWLGQLVTPHFTVLGIPDFPLQNNVVLITALLDSRHGTVFYQQCHSKFQC